MNDVLVTGATGLLGRHAAAALEARGFRVHGLARNQAEHRVDLFDSDAVRACLEAVRPSHLLHLAWITEPGRYWTAPENLEWQSASLDLVRAFHAAGGHRAVIAGSCAEYDWETLPEEPIDEGFPCRPASLYGAAKHALRVAVAALARSRELSYAWGRIFYLYGGPEPAERLVPSVARALLGGEEARCGPGTGRRDFIEARDAGAAFAALVDSDVSGPVNVASGESHTIAEVAQTIAELVGRPELLRLGALADRPGEPPTLTADVRRLREDVGFTPAVALRDGLAEAVRFWRSRAR